MKKILALFMACVMFFSLAACGKKDDGGKEPPKNEPQGFDYASATAEDLLNAYIKDRANIQPDEYKAILLTYANVKVDENLELEDNITKEAIKILRDEKRTLPSVSPFLGELFDNPAPQVRGFAVSQISSFLGVNSTNIDRAKKLLETETDEYVLYKTVGGLSNEGRTDPAIGAFLVKMAGHDNPIIRNKAVLALGNSWSIGVKDAVETVIKLMDDPDSKVRANAYRYAGKLNDERVIDPIVKMLNDPALYDYHDDGVNSLVTLWYDYPFHKNTSKRAYDVTLDYLQKKPSDKTPHWMVFTYFQNKASNYEEWKKKATYFDVDKFTDILLEVVKNPEQDFLARTAALKSYAAHASDADWAAAKKTVNGLTDAKADLVKKSIEQAESFRK